MKAFYFDIEADIAHFRDPMSHAFLNTFLAPPTHTVIGFLGTCCGFSEKETEEKLNNKILVGNKVLSIRGYLKDLVIMRNQKENKNIGFPRTRKFLVSPKYRIYVTGEDDNLLKEVVNGVASPAYTPYLGISDCICCIRYISKFTEAKKTKIKQTECTLSLGKKDIGNTTDFIKNTQHIDKKNVMSENFEIPEFYSTIKKEKSLTINPQFVTVPRSYEITEDSGRKPNSIEGLLMFSNCVLSFKKPLDGYLIDDEPVSLT